MFRKKQALVRILDTPITLMIKPELILVPYRDPNGKDKVILITGCFENITDDEAQQLAADATQKLHVTA